MYKLITYCPGIVDKNEAHSMLEQLTAIKISLTIVYYIRMLADLSYNWL